MPHRGHDLEPDTDEVEANTDWETAEVPRGAVTAELHRRAPRPCSSCGNKEWVLVRQLAALAHGLGMTTGPASLRGEALVCRRCGCIRWFVAEPDKLLSSPDYAATVIESV
jgi:hypothetical protein